MIQKALGIIVLLIAPLLSLTGCSIFSPIKTESSTTYVINTVPPIAPRYAHTSFNLLVAMPTANSIYNTPLMAYTARPYEIGYFVKSRWAETPSQMLRPLIVQSLQKTHYFHNVGSTLSLVHYDYILNTEIIQLQQDYSHYPYTVHLVLRAELINANTNSLVSAQEFSVSERIMQGNTYSGVFATNQATATVLRQLTQFCLNKIKQ